MYRVAGKKIKINNT